MATLVLARDYADLRHRLGQIVIGASVEGHPIKAEDLEAAGAMALLLREAFLPNLVQTLEGDPAFIHGGPFANIAHGNSSIIADRVALTTNDFVVTEAGFGSDMGAEKFMHIKARASGIPPDCVVMNVTVRSMKMHAGVFGAAVASVPMSQMLNGRTSRLCVLELKAISTDIFGTCFASAFLLLCRSIGSQVTMKGNWRCSRRAPSPQAHTRWFEPRFTVKGCRGFGPCTSRGRRMSGSSGAGRPFTPLIDASMGILDQTERIATELYGADGILIEPAAKRQLDRFVKWGYGTLPVCMAKTQYSFSHDPSLLGAPTGFTVPVREFRLNAGAGFIVAILGNMMTMPGLPARPAVRRWTSTSMETLSGCSVDAHERFLPELLNQHHMQILSKEPERWRLRVTSEDDLWALAQLIRPRMQFGMVGERRDQTTASGEGERARRRNGRRCGSSSR